jgi:2,3-dihydroxybiphenyl 1,2-dioxygenase
MSVPAVDQLGYLGFEATDVAAWERFAVEVLGLAAHKRDDGGLELRLDSHRQRFVVEPGAADDLAFVGWQVDDEEELQAISQRLRAAGVAVSDGSADKARRRRVQRLVELVDPDGIPTEIYYGPERVAEPFRSPVVRSGFVAEDRGLGHVVIAARDQKKSQQFYGELLGFKLSDRIVADIHGYHADISFFHANPRHHSLAIGAADKKRIHHFMVEARTFDEVGLAFDRTLKSGLRIMHTLGRHPNDRMFSFYARSPGGFNFEFGWGGRDVDDATWQPSVHHCISEWGHHPPQFLAPPPRKPQT